MKLSYTTRVQIEEYLIQGTILRYDEDMALSNTLAKIKNHGWESLGDLGVFEQGLKNYLVGMGYLTTDFHITPSGEEVAKTKMIWKGMSGRFLLKLIRYNGRVRVLDCNVCSPEPNEGYASVEDPLDLPDEYICSSVKLRIKHVDPVKLKYPSSSIDVIVSYDYVTGDEDYSVKGITFKNTDNFFIVDEGVANDLLIEIMANHYDLLIHEGEIIYCGDKGNLLTKKLVESVLSSDGSFEKHMPSNEKHQAKNIVISDARLKVCDVDIAEELFRKYIIRKSVSHYYRQEDFGNEIDQFYYLFDECPTLRSSPLKIRDSIIEQLPSNDFSRLHLQACVDLNPGSLFKLSLKNKDLSSTKISMNEFVKTMFEYDMRSLTMFSKYPSNNAAISKNILLLSKALHDIHGIKLKLITTELSTKRNEAKHAFQMIKESPDIELITIDENDARGVHDRYFMIINDEKSVVWMKTSGELDAIHFDNEGPNTETVGFVKEMSVSYHNADVIPSFVKKLMGGN